ncbi:phosphopantothenoylcysteine decarboxylase [Bacillus coahuilensis p1.1.43]|uniref:Coenzyme A biosynthesis bifunctional protein CoaBC n=1 Tax=Bacillus coahuilensis p1.1.43 TaxID=1150625 RepID=A0A147K9F5_9BACI|nr:bifunctional phosphopantothenoylcysteine decarboxylase/phosphopantothenate--cysteine ligase CoaBC [Bacillus coahuilensis]KUP07059.1 phosphopantothenoylcysteine decarboxylase [Bacillus coahuilensis p1.1.43]
MMNKNILLCVTGGIAVYKAVSLTSKLTQSGANVKVIMTKSAQKFVTPLTFQAISRNPVYTDTFDEKEPESIAHIDVADWADLIIVAPATANTIGKLANGIADDMISTTLLAATAPVWVAPAMNVHMYDHPAVKRNIQTLASFGYEFIEPSEGYLACGYVGKGRLEEPEKIVELVQHFFLEEKPLKGKRILITAGPTRESVDPVRFFTNRSTGKMGYSLAKEAVKLGATVTLVSGPVHIEPPTGLTMINVTTAEEMYEATLNSFEEQDVVIKTAAVADYRPVDISNNKMKKSEGELTINLERTKDILATLGHKKTHQFLVGFAAETDNVEQYAREKLIRKNADIIVANNVLVEGAGFGTDTNEVVMYMKSGESKPLPLQSKDSVAKNILLEINERLKDGYDE